MRRQGTSKTQEKFSKEKFKHLRLFKPEEGLENPKEILEALILCLTQNDLESFEDILIAHLRTVSKSAFQKKSGLGRQTLYDLIQRKRDFNPTLKTLGGVFKALAA